MKVYASIPLYKILLIGESNSGKTSLKLRYTEDTFPVDYKSTIGIDYKLKTIKLNNQICRLSIWDTAGQEKYRSLVKSFFHNTHGIILCFDICDKKSFLEARSYWVDEIKKFVDSKNEKCKVFLCGTKLDKKENRKVCYQDGKNLAEEFETNYFETSSMKNLNIEEMFNHVVEEINKINNPDSDIEENSLEKTNIERIHSFSKIQEKKVESGGSGCCR